MKLFPLGNRCTVVLFASLFIFMDDECDTFQPYAYGRYFTNTDAKHGASQSYYSVLHMSYGQFIFREMRKNIKHNIALKPRLKNSEIQRPIFVLKGFIKEVMSIFV